MLYTEELVEDITDTAGAKSGWKVYDGQSKNIFTFGRKFNKTVYTKDTAVETLS